MENQVYICENCGKEHDGSYGSGRFCCKQCNCSFNAKKTKNHICNWPGGKPKEGGWNCLCGLNFRTRKLLRLHRKECKINPVLNNGAWNKGLTKESDERVRKQGETYHNKIKTGELKSYWKDKYLPEEMKNKISNSLKNFYKVNPDKCTFVKYHKSNGDSYPEIYFMNIFDKNNIEYKKRFLFEWIFFRFCI